MPGVCVYVLEAADQQYFKHEKKLQKAKQAKTTRHNKREKEKGLKTDRAKEEFLFLQRLMEC